MSKRILSALVGVALVAGLFVAALPAKAQDPSAAKFFLRSTGCPAADANVDFLSLEDADEEIQCNYTGAGIRNEIGEQTGTIGAQGSNAVADRETATRHFDATDGIPVVLDASRPVTGEIWTSGAPVGTPGASLGEVIIDYTLIGLAGGNEVELGTFTETFDAVPAETHKTELNISVDPAAGGVSYETVELRVWVHGASFGHGVLNTNGETSSYISVPTASGDDPPGKNDPPGKGKKKGCTKGKGKKKGACPGRKNKKEKPVLACAPYAPGEQGADAETTLVTDAATEAAPVEVPITTEAGVGIGTGTPADAVLTAAVTHAYHNVQVDSSSPTKGLWVRLEMPHGDYDLYLNYSDGSTAARAAGFNPDPAVFNDTEGGGHTEEGAEQLDGVESGDCQGYTVDVATATGEGGDLLLKFWLGDANYAPPAPGSQQMETILSLF